MKDVRQSSKHRKATRSTKRLCGRLRFCGRPARYGRERLFVTDEVQISQSYMKDVFLPVLPKLYAKWEKNIGCAAAEFPQIGKLDRRRPGW